MIQGESRNQTIVVVGGGTSGSETGIRWLPAAGEGRVFQGGHAIGPCFSNSRLTWG